MTENNHKPNINFTKTMPDSEKKEFPKSIGHFKIIDIIGKGGMGEVYLAQQEKPIKRKVALKVIKPGMDSHEILARFESEQQALALMNHPSIAQVYESGLTEQGHPFFAMEYVPGLPITEYCDKHNLTSEERLELFVQVCEAVQHAHFKGIVHRDIKPSNILVTFQDNRHIPKIIDFGIAKAITGRGLTEKTLHTIHGEAVGTPVYMSPEQAELTGYDIDTRSDIYSLGIMLYELLVGVPPFENKDFEKAGLVEMLRIIREDNPPKPSTRFNSLGDTSTEVATKQRTTRVGIQKFLKGDLDWIVMKAIEKDRKRRYESATEFGKDIVRFIKREPILARPPSGAYRFKKFISRHKIAAAGLLAVIIMIGLAGALFRMQAVAKRANLVSERHEESAALATIGEWNSFTPEKREHSQQLISQVAYRILEGKATHQDSYEFAQAMTNVDIIGRTIQAIGNIRFGLRANSNMKALEGEIGILMRPRIRLNGSSIDWSPGIAAIRFSGGKSRVEFEWNHVLDKPGQYVFGGVMEARLIRASSSLGETWRDARYKSLEDAVPGEGIPGFLSDTLYLQIPDFVFTALEEFPDSYPTLVRNKQFAEPFESSIKVDSCVIKKAEERLATIIKQGLHLTPTGEEKSRLTKLYKDNFYSASLKIYFSQPQFPTAIQVALGGTVPIEWREDVFGIILSGDYRATVSFPGIAYRLSFTEGPSDEGFWMNIDFILPDRIIGFLLDSERNPTCKVILKSSRNIALNHFIIDKYLEINKTLETPIQLDKASTERR
jgi:serine/threonine protein kinase